MKLDKYKGIFVDKDGIEHPFGIYKSSYVNDLDESNFHESAFMKEIYPTEWFKSLNYTYTDDMFHYQVMNFAAMGIIALINGSSLTANGNDYLVYSILTPNILTEKQKEKMKESYEYLNNLINSQGAFFDGMAFLENSDYAWNDSAYSLDEFYDNMGIEKKQNNKNIYL